MKILVAGDYQEMSRKAANIIAAQIIMKQDSVLGLATGSTQIGIYDRLIELYQQGDLEFSRVSSFNLDEYCGLSPEHEQSYRYYMNQHLSLIHISQYLFGGTNERGLAKGRAFSSHLGYNANNWAEMRTEILKASRRYPAQFRDTTEYGDRYSQDIILYGKKNQPANVRVGWLVGQNGDVHMTTAHMEDI